jgi:hypothetical protein
MDHIDVEQVLISIKIEADFNDTKRGLPMKKWMLWCTGLSLFLALILHVQPALAHESITVGDYTLVVGWLNEPPVVGQHNAIVVEVSTTSDEQPVEDVSSLTLTISYGGQEKTLILEPLDEHSPGQYVAPILPTVPGEYSVIFGGTLGDTAIDAETHVEEVQPADTLAFPNVDSTQPETATNSGRTGWLAIVGFISGLAGLILSLVNMRRSRG